MHLIDWLIIVGLVIVLFVAALRTRHYATSVSAFLAADRCGGRYLISLANAMAGLGVITLVYWFEVYYEAGYTAFWWGSLTDPALIIIALSGWVVYRFRQTRAMTLAQFFEMRYSRNFRVFAGLVAFASGILNFGIFPAVGARFFIALCGLPQSFEVADVLIPTFGAIMLVLLSISLIFTFLGGHIAVMVTDFLQGVFANVVFAVVMIYLLSIFRWDQIGEALLQAPAQKSLVDPFAIGDQSKFDLNYFLIAVVVVFYSVLSWQGTAGYNCCAKDAHEAKMARILEGWRFRVLLLIAIVVPIVIWTMMHHPAYVDQATQLTARLDSVTAPTAEQTETLRTQLRVPHALAILLPSGLIGMFAAAMLAAFISTHDTYLHSWGSILVQDVILPFRKKPFTPRQHLWLLRLSILCVAVFIFVFSLLYNPTQYVAMFLAVSGAVFVGGAGSVIIGGLYWKRGTTLGAWGAMISGMLVSGIGIIIHQLDIERLKANRDALGFLSHVALYVKEEISGQELTFIAIVVSIVSYVLLSFIGPKQRCNMDRLLHRGKYAVAGETSVSWRDARTWLERLGVDREFTGWDRIVTLISIGWPIVWSLIIFGGIAYGLVSRIESTSWNAFWKYWTWIVLATSIAITIWFTIGGAKDLHFMFQQLKQMRDNPQDDGRVLVDVHENESPSAQSQDVRLGAETKTEMSK